MLVGKAAELVATEEVEVGVAVHLVEHPAAGDLRGDAIGPLPIYLATTTEAEENLVHDACPRLSLHDSGAAQLQPPRPDGRVPA
jgi:hypothetical protein